MATIAYVDKIKLDPEKYANYQRQRKLQYIRNERRKDKLAAQGICWICGKEPVCGERSKKCCATCLDRSNENNRRIRAPFLAKYYQKRKDNYRKDQRYSILHNAKKRAKQSGLPFDITRDDIVIPKFCPVLNIPLVVADNIRNDNSPTLDRIIPELGYVKGNIKIISFRANRIKSDARPEELQAILDYVERYAW